MQKLLIENLLCKNYQSKQVFDEGINKSHTHWEQLFACVLRPAGWTLGENFFIWYKQVVNKYSRED